MDYESKSKGFSISKQTLSGLGSTYLSGADIARADNVLHLAGHEQVSEGLRQAGCPLWDVNVADDQHEFADTIHCHCLYVFFLFIKFHKL